MSLDIRLPIGLMFAIIGGLLTAFGTLSDRAIYDRSLGININLWWGLPPLAFGVVMFLFGRKGTSAMRSADDTSEGRKMEQREERVEREGQSKRRGH